MGDQPMIIWAIALGVLSFALSIRVAFRRAAPKPKFLTKTTAAIMIHTRTFSNRPQPRS